jgi:flagellar protein FlgJ
MTKAEFLVVAKAAAVDASRASGFPAGIMVAQAALESAWGGSQLSREAHNYFGIKAHGKHAWIEMPTLEFENGVAVWVDVRFAWYGSIAECFRDRDELIQRLAGYAEARTCAENPEAFARAMGAHWATDPKYAEKLLRVWRENGLEAMDSLPAVTRGVLL